MANNFHFKNNHNSSQKLNLVEIILPNKVNQNLNQCISKRDIRKLVNREAIKSHMIEIKNSRENLIIQTIIVRTNPTKTINKDLSMGKKSSPTEVRTISKRRMIGTRIRITSQLTKSRHMFKMKVTPRSDK